MQTRSQQTKNTLIYEGTRVAVDKPWVTMTCLPVILITGAVRAQKQSMSISGWVSLPLKGSWHFTVSTEAVHPKILDQLGLNPFELELD